MAAQTISENLETIEEGDMNEEEEGQTEDEDYTATEETEESDSDSKVGALNRVFKFKSEAEYRTAVTPHPTPHTCLVI